MDGNAVRHVLAVYLLAGVLISASAGSAVSRSQPDLARRLLQDDKSMCENKYGRKTIDGDECCFPVTVYGKEYSDCVSDADKVWCATGPNDLLVECEPQDGGVREINSSGESTKHEEAVKKIDGFFAPAPTPGEGSELPADSGDSLNRFFNAPAPAPVAAERYTINDRHCSFPSKDPQGGEDVYDCFLMPEDYDVIEYDESSARTYCYPEGGSGKVEQCAAKGYKPGPQTDRDAGDKCFRKEVKTIGGKVCSFPQMNTQTKAYTCECYTIHNDPEDASYDDEVKYYCQPDGDSTGVVEECASESPSAAPGVIPDSTATDEESSSSSSSSNRSAPAPDDEDGSSGGGSTPPPPATEGSDTASTQEAAPAPPPIQYHGTSDDSNTLAIALGVGIPCGLLLIAGLAGLGYWLVKKRPAAKATSFSKFEGDNPVKGGAVSHKDVAKTGEGLSAVSRYTDA